MGDWHELGGQAMKKIALAGELRSYYERVVTKSRLVRTCTFACMVDVDTIVAKERNRTGKSGHHYTPPRTLAFEAEVREAVLTAMNRAGFPMLLCPLRMELITYSPKLARHDKDPVEDALADLNFSIASRWDLDNVAKSVSDALNQVLFADDRQVRQLEVVSKWSPDRNSRIHIRVTRIGLSVGEVSAFRQFLARMVK